MNNLGDQRNQDKPTTAPSSLVEPDGTQRQPNQAVNAAKLRAWALAAGFSEAGVVALPLADEERNAARVEQWIQSGRAGSMRYLERRDEAEQLLRARVSVPFPWARSVIVCFASYHADQPRSTDPAAADKGWIARYAWSGRTDPQLGKRPSDYHKVLLKRLKTLEARVRQELSGTYNADFTARAFVDTGPVVERSLAVAAGLGWTGKNTCLIHPKLGSYGFLAVLLTSLDVDELVGCCESSSVVSHLITSVGINPLQRSPSAKDSPSAQADRCGSCTRCIEACPTGALVAPYQMDATRCIAYLTIEHKGPIDEELMAGMGRQVFGCDICQDVCPWNRKAPITTDPELEARPELVNPALEALAAMDEAEFERLFNGSPVRRAGWNSLRRNIAIAMGNSGLARWNPALDLWKDAADEGLHLAARWALKRFEKNSLRG